MGANNKSLEEEIATLVRAEFAGIVASLEGEREEYRRRLNLKEEARRALEDAEAEARRLHSERIELKERFWEAYYGKGEVPFSELEPEPKSLGRAIQRAERALRKARANFERADFDDAAEEAALKELADITLERVDQRVGELQDSLGKLLSGVWRDAKESDRALRDELERAHFAGEAEGQAEPEEGVKLPEEPSTVDPATQTPARRPWWLRMLGT